MRDGHPRPDVAGAARGAAAHVIVADVDDPVLDADDAHHLGSVLRLRPGEIVSVTDGEGGWRLCHYGVAGRRDPTLEPEGEVVRVGPRPATVSVAFTPVKGERTEWAVQKLTEVGVDRIVLMHSERSVVRWDADRAAGHLDRLNKVARQAAMQSRSLWLPEVLGVFDIAELVGAPEGVAPAGPAMAGVAMAAPGGPGPSLERPCILVGPEGGWSPDELEFGMPLVGLGPSVLRTETAAVTAGVLLSALRAGLVRPSEDHP